MTTSGTTNDIEWYNQWQRVTTIRTMGDNEWYSEWQPMTKTSNEWQREKTNDKEWYNEWKQMREIFISEWNNYTIKTTIYSATSYWKYNVNQKIWRSSHRRCSIKKAAPNNFAIFTEKHLKACNFIKKRLQHKRFPVNNARFLRTPILKNIWERLLNCICF